MKIFAIILVIAAVAFNPLMLCAANEGRIIEMYNGSPNLPDWASYSMFLTQANAFVDYPDYGDTLLAKALDVDKQTSEGSATIDFYRTWFSASSSQIEREALAEELRILCSGDWHSMTLDEYIGAMREIETLRERLYQEHLEATLKEMSSKERSAFLAYLQEFKQNISYSKVDMSRAYEAKPESEIRMMHARGCEAAETSLANLNQEGQ